MPDTGRDRGHARRACAIPVYGRAYPEASAYVGTGGRPRRTAPTPLTKYAFPAGQAYATAGEAVAGDYYYAASTARIRVEGDQHYYPIRYNHRMAWVKASDVEEAAPVAPVSGANRYNVVARDSGGVLWQYQGTGNATSPC